MVVVKTKFDEQVTNTINKEQLKKLSKLIIFIAIVFALLGVFYIYKGNLIVGITLLVGAIVYFPLVKILTKHFQKKVNKTMSILSSQTEETYTFDSEFIQIEQVKGEEYSAVVKTKYSYLYQIIENKDNFLLYISKLQMHVIPKDRIVEGSVSELQSIFSENLKNKYQIKSR